MHCPTLHICLFALNTLKARGALAGSRNVQNVCQLSMCNRVHDNCCCCHCDNYHVPVAMTKDSEVLLTDTKVCSDQVTLHTLLRLHKIAISKAGQARSHDDFS